MKVRVAVAWALNPPLEVREIDLAVDVTHAGGSIGSVIRYR